MIMTSKTHVMLLGFISSVSLIAIIINIFLLFGKRSINDVTVQMVIEKASIDDLIAMVFWDKNSAVEIKSEILAEKAAGKRDKYFLPNSYIANLNNSHFDDTGLKGDHQKDVYMLARDLLRRIKKEVKRQLTVIDFGCGSGWKLVHYISDEFKTIGIETEPAFSFLKRTYPNQVWINSNKENGTLPNKLASEFGVCDLGISSDVIEHFRDPDFLISALKSFNCRVYVISTPKRELLNKEGPPANIHHVREWTFHEFQLYLMSRGFKVLKSFDGVQRITTQFHVVTL